MDGFENSPRFSRKSSFSRRSSSFEYSGNDLLATGQRVKRARLSAVRAASQYRDSQFLRFSPEEMLFVLPGTQQENSTAGFSKRKFILRLLSKRSRYLYFCAIIFAILLGIRAFLFGSSIK